MDGSKYEIYFDNLLNNMLEGVAIHRLIFDKNNIPIDYIVLKINKSYQEILGYSKDIEGKLASEIYGEIPALDYYSNVVINKKPEKFEFFYKKINKHFSISCAPWNDTGFITIFSDITNIIENKKLLRYNEKKLLRAEIISKTGNWELNIEKKILISSTESKKIFGFPTNIEKISCIDIKQMLLPEYKQLVERTLVNLIKNNKSFDIECKIKTLNSENKDIRIVATYNKKNNIIFGVVQDITQQKKNEKELEKSNETKSIFLSNVSHELKTPMTTIIGLSNILIEENENEKFITEHENIFRYLKSINSNAKYLDELLNNILDYSKITNSEFDILYENFSIYDLFDELNIIFQDINYEKNLNSVKINFFKHENKKIISDYLRLKQVLFNIISNSIKFTENGYINISYLFSDNFVTFKIEDTGIGIPEDKIKYIFNRFWQADSTSKKKYKGTGLGLSISKSITELLSGNICVESTINKGTTFYVKIPLEEIKKEKEKIEEEQLNFLGKTILILDDIPIEYSLLGIYLKLLNINILSADNESEFIKIYNEEKNKINVILIDINLHNKNTIELLKKIKTINKKCKIISKSVEKFENINIDYNLLKPINKNDLALILKELWQK